MTTSCPCGNFVFPKNTTLQVFTSSGLEPISCSFLHTNKDIPISAGQKFKTITSEINTGSPISILSYLINFGSPIIIENQVKIIIKSYTLDKILAIAFIGNLDQTNVFESIKIYGDNIVLSPILSSDRIILEIESICQEATETCCDKLPSSLTVSCILDPCEICIPINDNNTTTTTTTTTPAPGSCCDLNVGDTGSLNILFTNTNPLCNNLVDIGQFYGGTYSIISDLGWVGGLRTYYIRMNDSNGCYFLDGTLTCSPNSPHWDSVLYFSGCAFYTTVNSASYSHTDICNTPPNINFTGAADFTYWGCNYLSWYDYIRRICGRYEIRAAVQPCCANGLVLCHEIPQCAPDNYFCVPPDQCGYTYSIPYNDGICYVERQALGDGSLQCPEGWFYDSVNNTCYYRQCNIPNDLPESIQYTRDCGNGPEQLTSYNISWIDTQAQ
jgi:hypothetical protein